jgi:hypothetical protein
LVTPAVFFFEINKPLSFLGSQVLWLLQPLVGPLVGRESVAAYARLLEEPANVDLLLSRLQALQREGRHSAGAGDAAS